MASFRTLNEIRTIDPSLRTLRFNRSLREAGWDDELLHDDGLDAARGIICWGLLCAVVAIVLAVLL